MEIRWQDIGYSKKEIGLRHATQHRRSEMVRVAQPGMECVLLLIRVD